MPVRSIPTAPLSAENKAELTHRLRRAEGQVRGLQKLLADNADCTLVAQQLLATRHALDSTYVRLNLAVAEQALIKPDTDAESVGTVLDRLQRQLGRSR